ncbi:MAG TPA: hydrogenase maturation protease [bacterium]|nr:hydrogenase maturation protease [bacterium]HQO35517.1 hydrogenase maturation protease [bacterium]HQP99990.1 hydrogenase maturation protease [bacterium]
MNSSAQNSPRILIVGYGNPGRGDDAAGWLVAEDLEKRWSDRAEVLILHQLDIVVAEKLPQFDLVIFIDAEERENPPGRSLATLEPSPGTSDFTHTLEPGTLLTLAKTLYDWEPEAYLITVYAKSFEFGDPPSDETQRDIERAVSEIEQFLSLRTTASSPSPTGRGLG